MAAWLMAWLIIQPAASMCLESRRNTEIFEEAALISAGENILAISQQ
jgi:hypothetical protein